MYDTISTKDGLLGKGAPSMVTRGPDQPVQHHRLRRFVWDVVSAQSSNHWTPHMHDYGRESNFKPAYVFEWFMMILICFNSIVIVLDTVPFFDCSDKPTAAQETWVDFYTVFEVVCTAIFTIEYGARWWASIEDPNCSFHWLWGRLRWAAKPLSLLDLAALAPYYMEFFEESTIRWSPNAAEMVCGGSSPSATILRASRLLRLLSFARLERRVKGLKRIAFVMHDTHAELWMTMFLMMIMLVISSTLMYALEFHDQREDFSSIPAAMWWSVSAITTIGYGDIVPVTWAGKLLACLLSFCGIIMAALPTAIISSGLSAVLMSERKKFKETLQQGGVDGKGSHAIKSGYLKKNGFSFLGRRKRRWFTLTSDGRLHYYQTEDDLFPVGTILLRDVQDVHAVGKVGEPDYTIPHTATHSNTRKTHYNTL